MYLEMIYLIFDRDNLIIQVANSTENDVDIGVYTICQVTQVENNSLAPPEIPIVI
jgi:hypothetical protein